MKICIIDDNVEILELLKNILEATGNEVFTADNGIDGLSVILNEKFNLVILDITMPEFSGIDVVRYLDDHEKLRDQNIMFLTAASVQDSEIQKWLDKGVKACLKKPVDMDELFEHVMEVEMT
jgi:DNA-binding response OmpR family regulator